MKDHGMIYSAPMVRALIAGSKSQTRRLLNPQPRCDHTLWPDKPTRMTVDEDGAHCGVCGAGVELSHHRKSGVKGIPIRFSVRDRIWVRETTIIAPPRWTRDPINPMGPDRQEVAHVADYKSGMLEAAADYGLKKRPAIHMPRWASRITLTITDVRVQKLQEITEEDAIAEGLIKAAGRYVVEQGQQYFGGNYSTARQCSSHLWDSLHGDPGKRWKDNPFVVALTFSTELRNIDSPALEPARQQVPA